MSTTGQQLRRTGTARHIMALISLMAMAAACGGGDDSATPTVAPAEPDPSLEQATTEIIGIVDAFNTVDLTYINTLLGSDGVWSGINGGEWRGPRAAEMLTPLLRGITLTEILGEGVHVADGWAFPLREHKGNVTIDYSIVVGRNADDAALVTEEWSVPPPVNEPASCASPTPGAHDVTLTIDGTDQAVRVFVPSAVDGTVLPAVIDWHATGETAAIEEATSDYEVLAEKEGFVVAHPATTPRYDVQSWQTADGTAGLAQLLASALIDELIANWCADAARIYSTGFSLGSLFTTRLVCSLSDRLAAAVSVAGTFHMDDC